MFSGNHSHISAGTLFSMNHTGIEKNIHSQKQCLMNNILDQIYTDLHV